MDILESKNIKTRKQHRCGWCDEVIEKGETCNYQANVDQGDFYHGWMHLECNAALNTFCREWETNEPEYNPGMFIRGTTDER